METLTQDHIRLLLPARKPDSHKGENGRVLIVGGHSEFCGAHVLAGLGALRSGADIVRLFVPDINVPVVRSYAPEFIVRGFSGDVFKKKHIAQIRDWISESDCIVAGMGSKSNPDFSHLLEEDKNFVLDSSAIFALKKDSPNVLITPHQKEFESFSGVKTNVLLKGTIDKITSYNGETIANETGDPGMTVGGSGDVLAGLCGGLIAQGLTPFEAAQVGAFVFGKAGEKLAKTEGNCYGAKNLAYQLPMIFSQLSS